MSDDVPILFGDASLVRLREIIMILELYRDSLGIRA
jgi:hypothetical protein